MKSEEVMGVMWLVPRRIKDNNCLDIINKHTNSFNINTPVFPGKTQQARIRSQKHTFSQDIRQEAKEYLCRKRIIIVYRQTKPH